MSGLSVATGRVGELPGCLAALTLTYNYYHLWFAEAPNVDHVWSLCVEEHSYILLGLIALLWRRFGFALLPVLAALAALACLNGLISTALGGSYTEVYWRSDVRAASILLGAAAYLKLGRSNPMRTTPSWRPAVLLLLGLVLNVDVVPDPIKYSLGTASLLRRGGDDPQRPDVLRRGLTSTPLVLFGAWSYSILPVAAAVLTSCTRRWVGASPRPSSCRASPWASQPVPDRAADTPLPQPRVRSCRGPEPERGEVVRVA